MNKRN
jgi:pyruvate carboxylase